MSARATPQLQQQSGGIGAVLTPPRSRLQPVFLATYDVFAETLLGVKRDEGLRRREVYVAGLYGVIG
ncbi:MAG TPA: hypothetical protein VF221_13875 [Chloroflexota bacterium]